MKEFEELKEETRDWEKIANEERAGIEWMKG